MNKRFFIPACFVLLVLSSCVHTENNPIPSNTSILSSSSFSSYSVDIPPRSSSEVKFKTLKTPELKLNQETGSVSWTAIEEATYYRYYINGGDFLTTTATSIVLTNGQSVVVMADSSSEYTIPSEWSNPLAFYSNDIQSDKTIRIYFHDTELPVVEITKGSTYTPKTPTKDGATFDAWYADPYHTKQYDFSKPFNQNTVVYAGWIEDYYLQDTYYWVKCNSMISSSVQSSDMSWRFIPLQRDHDVTEHIEYSATVNVVGATDDSPAQFLIMDGIDDLPGRTYWKKGSSNFSIKSPGTYKIHFSLETQWKVSDSLYVHAWVEKIQTNYSLRDPQRKNEVIRSLAIPEITIDKVNERALWTAIEGADAYEYMIDNGKTIKTMDTAVVLHEGSFICVRALADDGETITSLWSRPYINPYKTIEVACYLFFFDSSRPSIKIEKGTKAQPFADPTKQGYTFDGWYLDIGLKKPFDFDMTIEKNTVIYPKWTPIEDYRTTVYYTLCDEKGSKLVDLYINEDCLSYNEYYGVFTLTEPQSVYVNSTKTDKRFGPYIVDSPGTFEIYFSEEHIWNVNTEKAQNAYIGLKTTTIYFTNALYWEGTIRCYLWKDDNILKSWPGTSMTYVKTNSYNQNIYKIAIPASLYSYAIFNNNESQTVNLDISSVEDGTGFYTTSLRDAKGRYECGIYKYA